MAFVTGSLLIDAPASALNNSGERIQGARTENTVSVKSLRAQDGRIYPYVSGQALRYWLRDTLERHKEIDWRSSPTYRGDKVAFSDANPILYWDDDLFGYMRAPNDKDNKNTKENRPDMTPLSESEKGKPITVTRHSPFRIGTLVAVAPMTPEVDFGTMTRTEGDPVPYEHEFYRGYFHTLFSLSMGEVGTFTTSRRSGYQNLDEVRIQKAEAHEDIVRIPDIEPPIYRLNEAERVKRIAALLKALGRLEGGAKQASHYTDVSPALAVCAVVKGGNHPFNYLFDIDPTNNKLKFKVEVLRETVQDLAKHDRLLSPIYIALKPGFLTEEAANLQLSGTSLVVETPISVFNQLAEFITANPHVMDA